MALLTPSSPHKVAAVSVVKSETGDEDEDPYLTRIRATGCFHLHEALQDCHFDTKDWRACKEPMRLFQRCMEQYSRSIGQQVTSSEET